MILSVLYNESWGNGPSWKLHQSFTYTFCYLQLFFTYSSFVKVNLQRSYKIDKIDCRRCIGQNKDHLAGAERAKHQK
jgi:hypothetical protein